MSKHMVAQKQASLRNSLVEIYSHYLFKKALEASKQLEIIEVQPQKEFKESDTSDVFDHFAKIKVSGQEIHLWGQVTCYKGQTKKAESNKTYEVRETLVESLNLRKWYLHKKSQVRTFHITYGPADYAYGWISSAKNNSFDFSIYPTTSTFDIYSLLNDLKAGTYFEFVKNIENELKVNKHFSGFTTYIQDQFKAWIDSNFPVNPMADAQAHLLLNIMANRPGVLGDSQKPEAIKPMVINAIEESIEPKNKNLKATIQKTLAANPFLLEAFKALANWDSWCETEVSISGSKDLKEFLLLLWESESPSRLVKRRLLLRTLLQDNVQYLQDMGIENVTEHTLYIKSFSDEITTKIIKRLLKLCDASSINSSKALQKILTSKAAYQLVKHSFKFELKNGTNLKPSFYYVEECLKNKFTICKREESELAPLIGYQIGFEANNVSEYTNFKIIKSKKTGKALAILKSKFFNKPEFPRRCKEEAYVGVTTLYELKSSQFALKNPECRLIMFVDMDSRTVPPVHSVNLLRNWGWDVFFNMDSLIEYLDSLDSK